ncbi:MAG: prolipoprotein diacylglyceryl transferase, partial [Lentisphaeraceae bacterium]|nr:prolipoprotein diacylglyceryl transferase [Lentisphaeraceae bacterium]
MIGALVGARLLYVITNYNEEFAGDFIKIFKINQGGIVFQGGFIGALLVAWFFCKKKNFDFLKGLDIIAPAIALGHAMGRIGCFLNGCCFGGICKTGPSVRFPKDSLPYNSQLRYHAQELMENGIMPAYSLPIHPTQLYSFAANLLICLILVLVTIKVKAKGQLFGLYLMLYGVWRLLVEFLRDDQARHLGLSVAQYIAIGQFVVGLAMWMYFAKKFSVKVEAK